jgi:hypothetical protein
MLRIFTGKALFLATDETQIKHGFKKDIEKKGTEKTEAISSFYGG